MNYAFGSARESYRRRVHPRVLMDESDLGVLRRRVRRGAAARIMADLRLRVAPLAARVSACADLPDMLARWADVWNNPGTTVVMGIADLAFQARLDGDAAALDAVRRVLAAAPQADRPASNPRKQFGLITAGRLSMAYDIVHPALTPAERRAFSTWARRAGVEAGLAALGPNSYRAAGGNINVGVLTSALRAALAIRGDAGVGGVAPELQELIHRYEAAVYCAIGVDGYPEEDMGYGPAVAQDLLTLGEFLSRAGLFDVFREIPRVLRFGEAMLHFVQPWGGALSNTGDHGDDFGDREYVLARLAARTGRRDLLWLLGTLTYDHGRVMPAYRDTSFFRETGLWPGFCVPATSAALLVEPLFGRRRPPARRATAYLDRTRGLVSLRSGWDADATFVTFDGSQRGYAAQGHAHASCGHFSISALGEYFSIDTGRYNIEQSCHSVVLVNGRSGRSTGGEWVAAKHAGRLVRFAPGPLVDTASVDSSHQHNIYRAHRHLFLVKGAATAPYVVVVDDLNACDDWAEYSWQMQTSPENRIALRGREAIITGWRHGHRLKVSFVLPAPGEYPKPHTLRLAQDVAGVSSTKYVKDPAASVAAFDRPAAMVHGPVFSRPRLLGIVEGYNGRFLTVLQPYRAGERAPAVRRLRTVPGTLGFEVRRKSVVDTFIFAYENHLLEAGDIRARGQWCLVRRRADDGRVVAHALGDGDSLRVGGEIEWRRRDGGRAER